MEIYMRYALGTGFAVALAVVSLGCGEQAPPPRPVSEAEGAVTYDGEPVPSGIISFVPLDGGTGTGAAVIKGRYRVEPDAKLTPGKYRVEIRWGKPTGEKIKDASYGQSPDVIAEGLPAKYNSESTLTIDVKAGPNSIDFHLEK
jgi:hypothetical protein